MAEKYLLRCFSVVSLSNCCWFGKSQACDFGLLYPVASQLILRYVCHLSFIWLFIVLINPLTCRPLFSSEPFVLSYIWDKDAKALLLSHSLYPELQLNSDYDYPDLKMGGGGMGAVIQTLIIYNGEGLQSIFRCPSGLSLV